MNSKNTKPEIKVQRILLEKGIYFLKHIKTLAGTPDIIIPSIKIILDIKGCFWHQHGCLHSKLPKSNQLFWIDKFSKINSALFSLFALIPPTFAAAKITASGFILLK